MGIGVGLSGCALQAGGSSASPTLQFDNCSSDCGLGQNGVAAGGAHTTILVNGGVRFVGAQSSNPAVALFTADGGDGKVDVESGVPGTAELQLLDGSGHVIMSGVVTVVPTATLRPNQGWNGAAPIVLAGEALTYHVTTLDGNGKVTKGDGSVDFTLSGTVAPVVALVDGDAIAFTGTVGTGTIDATCTNAAVSQDITVVGPADITAVNMAQQLQPNDQAVVTVVPQSAGGPVYTGGCAWQVSDPTVTLEADVAPRLDLGAGEVAIFNINRAGTYGISCTVAGQTTSVTVSR